MLSTLFVSTKSSRSKFNASWRAKLFYNSYENGLAARVSPQTQTEAHIAPDVLRFKGTPLRSWRLDGEGRIP